MSIEAAEFRRILGHLATGVAVVSCADPEGGLAGMTATAVASVSLDPPLVLACVDRAADTHGCIERAGAFAISILGADDEPLARRFADYTSTAKFDGVEVRRTASGTPVLGRSLAWVECTVRAAHDGGDHTIYVGAVVGGDARDGSPLLHFQGGYHRLGGS